MKKIHYFCPVSASINSHLSSTRSVRLQRNRRSVEGEANESNDSPTLEEDSEVFANGYSTDLTELYEEGQ